MSGNGRTIYIAGAGIAGLTLALALAKFGATVVVLERNAKVQEVGAGLQISPNARHVLDRLGVDRALHAAAFEPKGIDIYPFGARRPLTTLELGGAMLDRFGAPYAVMHRADLAELLHKACKRFANIDILFGVRAYDVVSHSRGVSVTVDESDGKSRSARAFAFIGADGVRSRTRTDMLMGPQASYTGRVAWRITLGQSDLSGIVAQDKTSLLWGPGYHAVTYPLPHRKQMNVALFMKAREADVLGDHPPKAPKLPWSATGNRRFDDIIKLAGDDWGYWPLFTVDTDKWSEGGIGIIGDAAHAMVPFQAQGAAMAIEDAAVLAPLLMTDVDADTALRRYQAIRQPRVERVKKLSEQNGFAFHMEWPFSLGRDAVVKSQGPLGHINRLAWLYGYDPSPDPAGIPSAPQLAVRDAT